MIKTVTENELIEKYCKICKNTIQVDEKTLMCKYFANIKFRKQDDLFAKEYYCKYFLK